MHLYRFASGGFVIHKLKFGKGKVSAWFDAEGTPVDAERFDRRNRQQPVRPGTPLWRYLQTVGKLHRRKHASAQAFYQFT